MTTMTTNPMTSDQVDSYIYREVQKINRMDRNEMLTVITSNSAVMMDSNLPLFGILNMTINAIDKNTTHDLTEFSPIHMKELQVARRTHKPISLSFEQLTQAPDYKKKSYIRLYAISLAFVDWYYKINSQIVVLNT